MSLYLRKDTNIWWVSARHAGRRLRVSTGETDRRAAEEREKQILIELWQTVPNTNQMTWGQAVDRWMKAKVRSDSELLSLVKFGKKFPDRELSKVTPEAIDKALSFCKTASTYTRYRTMIAAILKMGGSPLKLLSRRGAKPKPRMFLTPAQWKKLYAELPTHLKAPALFSLQTGLRQQNALGLTWDRVDLDRSLVWVDATDTKAGHAINVPLNASAWTTLSTLWNDGSPVHKTFVFVYRGKPFKEVKTAFMAACIRAGLGHYTEGSKPEYEGFTWHGLRHTWATWHAQRGTPLDVIQALGGWSDLRMVMNYRHHTPSHLASFAGNIEPNT
jgi:integrase